MTESLNVNEAADGRSDSNAGLEDAAPDCWWINYGSYGQITMRADEAEKALAEGARVYAYSGTVMTSSNINLRGSEAVP